MPRRKTHQEFLSEMESRHPTIQVLGEYSTSKDPISVECKVCGYRWSPQAGSLQQGKGCPRCAGKLKRTTEQFVFELSSIQPAVEVLGEYVSTGKKIEVRCRTCNHEWEAPPVSLLKGSGCPKCAGNIKKTTDEFREDLQKINPDIEVLGDYVNSKTQIEIRCKRCNQVWRATPNSLLRGSGCLNCYHGSTSFLEQCIYVALRHVLGKDKVLNRDKRAIGAELDIYIPSKRLAVEPGAWHWHQHNLENDWRKRKLCQKYGIRLITVYDSCSEATERSEDVYYFKEDLGRLSAESALRQLVEDIALLAGAQKRFTAKEWEEIKSTARLRVSKKTTSDFIEELSQVNPDIEVKGEYASSSSKIRVECMKCHHLWEATPSDLLGGHGCPKCSIARRAAKQRKTHEAFSREIIERGYPVSLLSTYNGDSRPIKARCTICGHIWNPTPNNLLHGEGCPICGRAKADKKRQKAVVCVETGIRYEGVTKAAEAVGVSQSAISNALRSGGESGGYHWAFTANKTMKEA